MACVFRVVSDFTFRARWKLANWLTGGQVDYQRHLLESWKTVLKDNQKYIQVMSRDLYRAKTAIALLDDRESKYKAAMERLAGVSDVSMLKEFNQ